MWCEAEIISAEAGISDHEHCAAKAEDHAQIRCVLLQGAGRRGMDPAIGNVGVKPTVEDSEILLTEVNLFDYDREAYGKEITVQFYEFERPERKFESIEALKTQLETDILFGKNYFSGNGR